MRLEAVSAGPTTLLHVALKRPRERVVNNEAHVPLIDTHAECDSGYDHLDLVAHPLALDFVSLLYRQFRMIIIALDPEAALELLCHLLALFSRHTVNDAGKSLEAALQQ